MNLANFLRPALVAAFALTIALSLPSQSSAQQLSAAVIAVVDVQFILQKSDRSDERARPGRQYSDRVPGAG